MIKQKRCLTAIYLGYNIITSKKTILIKLMKINSVAAKKFQVVVKRGKSKIKRTINQQLPTKQMIGFLFQIVEDNV